MLLFRCWTRETQKGREVDGWKRKYGKGRHKAKSCLVLSTRSVSLHPASPEEHCSYCRSRSSGQPRSMAQTSSTLFPLYAIQIVNTGSTAKSLSERCSPASTDQRARPSTNVSGTTDHFFVIRGASSSSFAETVCFVNTALIFDSRCGRLSQRR